MRRANEQKNRKEIVMLTMLFGSDRSALDPWRADK